jgi:SNF2 family DNA or RNA helicase
MSAILKGLMPFILRRTKEQVLKDLPQKVESYIYCDFEKEQAKIYKDMKKFYQQSLTKKIKTDDMNKSKIHILEALLRMRQISCHPGLVNKEYINLESSKVKVLIENIIPLIQSKQKVLVFSQFTSFLKIIKDKLDENDIKSSYLDGQTTRRQDVINDFKKNEEKSVFLISLKAGGVGLNLTEASYCFLVDPWWNPAIEAQAIDRIHRIGQKKKVFAYRLITRDSIEEKILKLQKSKLKVSNKIMATDQSFLKQLSKEDLSFLLN